MSLEAELPGNRVIPEELQMIYTRYHSITSYIKDKDVLEVGCGPGLGLGFLNHHANRVVGGDYSPSNVAIAQEYYKNRVEVLVLDAHDLPFKTNSFDVIVTMEVLHYLDVPKFLSECHKVLRENGILLACIPNKDRAGFVPSNLSKNYFSVPELYALFQSNNFKPEIYGAFKVSKGTSDEVAWDKSKKNRVISIAGTILRALPGGKSFKNFLAKKMFKKIQIPNELTSGLVEPGELVPLKPDEPNSEYKILYMFSVKQ
jgi:SAM-dependent methyltransferase